MTGSRPTPGRVAHDEPQRNDLNRPTQKNRDDRRSGVPAYCRISTPVIPTQYDAPWGGGPSCPSMLDIAVSPRSQIGSGVVSGLIRTRTVGLRRRQKKSTKIGQQCDRLAEDKRITPPLQEVTPSRKKVPRRPCPLQLWWRPMSLGDHRPR